MKYNIQINQLELSETNLDLIDCAILDYLIFICNSKNEKIEKERRDGYTWINFSNLLNDMPLIRLKSKQSISTRMKKIEKTGFIKTIKNKRNRFFVLLEPKIDTLFVRLDRGVRETGQGGVRETGQDNTTNNNITKDNFCETSSQDDQKDFKPSPSLIRKISLVEKAAAASKSFLSDMEDKDGIVALVEDENVTYPPNFNSQVAIKKLISPHENAKGKIVKPQRHIAVIGLYVLAKKMEVISDEQLASIIKRNVRAANLIKEYPFKRIIETMKFLVDKADFKWTLETVSKFIDEDLGKTNLNDLGKKSSGKVLGEDVMVKD